MADFEYDVCVVGTGRVGLPLALALIGVGYRVAGVDRDERLRKAINIGKMPFHEPGFEAVVATGKLRVFDSFEAVAHSRNIIITVGTPLHSHIETDLDQVRAVLFAIKPYLRQDQLICLRSTVAPGTTRYVSRWLAMHAGLRVGHDVRLAMCPERLAEGKAREELGTLPQIIGSEDTLSAEAAEALFTPLGCEMLHTDYVSAELTKLFNNTARYIHFAVANQFAIISDLFGANVHEVRRLANHKYPRGQIAMPGLTAGTCLRKDFGMINEWSPYPDLLLSAWKVNEYMPAFLVKHMKQRTKLHGCKVAVLGYSFKADTDDVRDSLSPKLLRYLERELPIELCVSDRCLPDPLPNADMASSWRNWPESEALNDADCVFVAVNHAGYREVLQVLAESQPQTWIADIWNVGEIDLIFYQASELRSSDATKRGEVTR